MFATLQKKHLFILFSFISNICTSLSYGQSTKINSIQNKIPQENIVDIAIIGGGISGLYSAYQLIHAEIKNNPALNKIVEKSGKKNLTVHLYEMNNRLGGRIWSVPIPSTSFIAELGAMRFSPIHQNIYGLITKELELEIVEFPMDKQIVYLRDHLFTFQDYSNVENYPGVVPYYMKKNEVRPNPYDLMIEALYTALPNARLTKSFPELKKILQTEKVDGKYLYQWGFWNFLMDQLDPEAFQLLYDTFGYSDIDYNRNAYDTYVQFFQSFFQNNKILYTVKAGMQEIPNQLAKRFVAQGGQVYLNHKLQNIQKIDREGQHLLELTFSSVEHPSSKSSIYAQHVILALPKLAIQSLDQNAIIFKNQEFKNDLDSVISCPANKLFLLYPSAWWKNIPYLKGDTGKSSTNLPLQSIYYLGVEAQGKYSGYSLLLASYATGRFTNFWSSFMQMDNKPYETPFVKKEAFNQKDLLPSFMLVHEAQKELKECHRYPVPDPVLGIYIDWSGSTYGEAYHFWKQNMKSWEIAPRIQHPFSNMNIYIVGESYCPIQGWIEGALNTAESVLEKEFKLKPPSWISDPNYFEKD